MLRPWNWRIAPPKEQGGHNAPLTPHRDHARHPAPSLALHAHATEAPDEPVEDVHVEPSWEGRDPAVGDEVILNIELRNDGQADAHNLKIALTIPPEIQPCETSGTDKNASVSKDFSRLGFPTIPTLRAGEQKMLRVRFQAKSTGYAPCRVEFTHKTLGDITLLHDELLRVR